MLTEKLNLALDVRAYLKAHFNNWMYSYIVIWSPIPSHLQGLVEGGRPNLGLFNQLYWTILCSFLLVLHAIFPLPHLIRWVSSHCRFLWEQQLSHEWPYNKEWCETAFMIILMLNKNCSGALFRLTQSAVASACSTIWGGTPTLRCIEFRLWGGMLYGQNTQTLRNTEMLPIFEICPK